MRILWVTLAAVGVMVVWQAAQGAEARAAEKGPAEAQAVAQAADAVLGQWLSEEADCRFEFYKEKGKYYGKIVWLKEPVYPAKDKEAGKPIHDRQNPDAAKRDQPLVGLTMLNDFVYKGDNTWGDGTIYNPDNGKTYSARLRLDGTDKLKVRGYIGISLIGGTTTWTRYEPPKSK